jgi:RNA polymerase sigma factor (sigma-70 family)
MPNNNLNIILKGPELEAFIAHERNLDIAYLRKNMGISQENAEDIYQDSCIALITNIRNGKLTKLTTSLSSYLLQICKYQATHLFRRQRRINSFTDDDFSKVRSDLDSADDNFNDDCIDEILDLIDDEDNFYDEILDQVEELVQNLPEPCHTLIWGKFWEKLSHNELAKILDYRSANVSKTQLSRCLDKFQAKISSLIN